MIEKSEYQARIHKLSRAMQRDGVDGMILTADANIEYFSGFRHHAPWTLFARPFFQIISADGRSALLTHTFLELEMRRTAAVHDVYSFSRSGQVPVDEIRQVLAHLGLARGRLGMELGCEQRLGISSNDFMLLRESLPDFVVVDASLMIWRLRTIKSKAEIELIRRSAAVTGAAFAAAFGAARPGMTEKQISQICTQTMLAQGADRPGFVLVASGQPNYTNLAGKPTDRQLRSEDMLWIDMGAVVDGYWSDFCRSAYFGEPRPVLEESQKMILDVNQAMIESVRPGQTMRDVAESAERQFQKSGYSVSLGTGRIGHGIGLMSTEPPHVALYDETICEEGLVFTIEPRITNESGVFNCEEMLAVTETGVDILTSSPRGITYIN